MIVLKDDEMCIIDVEHTIKGRYNTSIYPGRYIRNNKGYWYLIEIGWGYIRRIRYVGQVQQLNILAS